MAILTAVRDPRVKDVTVTRVEMDPDMRAATVHVSVMGSPAKEELALRGLANSAGFLQSQVAERNETRYTPRLKFQLDSGVKKSIEIARVLSEVLPKSSPESSAQPTPLSTPEAATPTTEEPALKDMATALPQGPVIQMDMEKSGEHA